MTARTCPIHGEYSATGVCRWCESDVYGESPGAQALRNVKALVDAAPTYMGMKVVIDPNSDRDGPVFVSWPLYLPTAKDLPIQPPVVLEYQHASLRWERVARRWEAKGKRWGTLQERFADWARAAWALHREQPP